MKEKLKRILLVDDDNDCNFFHKRLLTKMDCVEEVQIANNGLEALDFLSTIIDGKYPSPEIIFLDINMPRMNGWEFLEKYAMLEEDQKAKNILIMLTTSLNPDDKILGMHHKDVKGFYNKFLSKETLSEILVKYFPDHF